ncbi:Hypothetical predicted protein [Octopus vulgaris]|uniref:Uncharacterized protein n=1 Tax=Octopus vulgaris TaxID=6645 RepID=A0AA36AX94_OCTVU|nr:Hypothetical predicted protein [Octopus vulgaris]
MLSREEYRQFASLGPALVSSSLLELVLTPLYYWILPRNRSRQLKFTHRSVRLTLRTAGVTFGIGVTLGINL